MLKFALYIAFLAIKWYNKEKGGTVHASQL